MNVFIGSAGALGSTAAYEVSRAGYARVHLYVIDIARGRTIDIRRSM
ncbi:MAG: hypothetical protein ACOCTG_06230 [Bacteroidota bacterium]